MSSTETPRLEQGAHELELEDDATRAIESGSVLANQATRQRRGDTLGRYVVLDELGAGGMGVVYAAYDPDLDRKVAIKVLRHEAVGSRSQDQARLLREAQAMAKLSHPNVLPVFDVGTVDGQIFIATEHVDGSTLSQWLREGARSWREVVNHFLAAGKGLAAAHAAGFVHRDFKPGNVLLGRDGTVRVMDFGLVRRDGDVDHARQRDETPVADSDDTSSRSALTESLTHHDLVVGTPPYMAPEQHLGAAVDSSADQYSFCVALYRGLYHQFPFENLSGARLFAAKQALDLAPLTRAQTAPWWLRRIVLRGLDPDPTRRWPSMKALLAALERDPRKSAIRWGVGAIALVGALSGGWLYGTVQDRQQAMCSGGPAKLAGVWDSTTQERIERAFAGTKTSYAGETWKRVRANLDVYATDWVEMHGDTCRATHVRKEQSSATLDLRMTCLRGRLRELEGTTNLFSEADAEVVKNAVTAVDELPAVQDCARLDRLQTKVLPPPAKHQAAVEDLRDQFASLRAFERSGKYAAALPLAERALEQARTLEYAPVQAEAGLLVGGLQDRLGRFEIAAKTLSEAAWSAESLQLDELTAEAQIILVGLWGDSLKRLDDGLEWGNHARAAVARLGDNPDLEASLASSLGAVNQAHGRLDEAREYFEKALQARRRANGPHDLRLAGHYGNLGIVASLQHRYDEAIAHYNRAAEIWRTRLAPTHPNLGILAVNLAITLDTAGRYGAAHDEIARALDILESSLGPDHTYVGSAYHALGSIADNLGDHDLATQHYQRALDIQGKALGAQHPRAVEILQALNGKPSRTRTLQSPLDWDSL